MWTTSFKPLLYNSSWLREASEVGHVLAQGFPQAQTLGVVDPVFFACVAYMITDLVKVAMVNRRE